MACRNDRFLAPLPPPCLRPAMSGSRFIPPECDGMLPARTLRAQRAGMPSTCLPTIYRLPSLPAGSLSLTQARLSMIPWVRLCIAVRRPPRRRDGGRARSPSARVSGGAPERGCSQFTQQAAMDGQWACPPGAALPPAAVEARVANTRMSQANEPDGSRQPPWELGSCTTAAQ